MALQGAPGSSRALVAAHNVVDISDSDEEESVHSGRIDTPPRSVTTSPTPSSPSGESPPAYYAQPNAVSFDFAPAITTFLRDIHAGPRALCIIDRARDFEHSSWRSQFLSAGLSEDEASTLQGLFMDSLSSEQSYLLLTAQGEPSDPENLYEDE
ncbi:hypothetical protein HWV62_16624 [Athelia sp. TMB]|nr:hypothetical protein HWV62_16624 [Athelia sp. TMB]